MRALVFFLGVWAGCSDGPHYSGGDLSVDPNADLAGLDLSGADLTMPPPPTCTPPVSLADTSNGRVVGDGRPESCTEQALQTALSPGGAIRFDCGAAPKTITITTTLTAPVDKDTILDGGGRITLDGGNAVRILSAVNGNYRVNNRTLTLQRLAFKNGKAPGNGYVPPSTTNPKCAYGYREGGGGAVLIRDIRLTVIDCVFENDHAATPGPDVGGGGIYALGSLGVIVSGSVFANNSGSNAGAVGLLQSNGTFVNTTFSGNTANGTGQNYAGGDAQGCPGVGHANQGGAGGNGGALAVDGSDDTDLLFCGCRFTDKMR
jgi:hypothetical protein